VDFAPYDNPRIAGAVVVEHGGGGSAAAAPIGRDITMYALWGGFPPLEAYPEDKREEAAERMSRIRAIMQGRPVPALERA
jgi:penicillin-binding protein 2